MTTCFWTQSHSPVHSDVTNSADVSGHFPKGSRMIPTWPPRTHREQYEIDQFVHQYCRLTGRHLQIISRAEKPDFIVRDCLTGEELGVELTSVYVTDTEVPDEHLVPGDRWLPYSRERVHLYEERLTQAILSKISKAKTGYDITRRLLLSVYANGHDSIYVDWSNFLGQLRSQIRSIDPFEGILFWPLPAPFPERDDAPIGEEAILWKPGS